MKTATWFGLWAVAGAAGALGVLTVLSIGVFVLPAALALGAVLAWRAPRQLAGPGIVTGLGLPLLYVGYLNRSGPGTICTAVPGGQNCIQETSPWPWVGVGLVLVLAGVVLALAASRRRPRARSES
ncbi:MAG: hypothetical protein J2P27_04145 [Actinobacteria bacterium]|nr:hypothetical protein [Actinomycetota bacterium]